MKSFLCVLAVVAAAYAEADADAQCYGAYCVYNTLGYNGVYSRPISAYSSAYARPVATYSNIYSAPSAYSRYLGKREAEAEPEADAQYLGAYNGVYNTLGYNNIYNNVAVARSAYIRPAVATTAYRGIYSAPSVYSAARYLGKREAEAEPEAEAQYLNYNGVYNTLGYNNLYNGVYNTAAVRSVYASPSVYSAPASIYSGLRYYGKREAEADADAQYLVRPYSAYNTLGYNAYNAYDTYPVASYNAYRTYGAYPYVY